MDWKQHKDKKEWDDAFWKRGQITCRVWHSRVPAFWTVYKQVWLWWWPAETSRGQTDGYRLHMTPWFPYRTCSRQKTWRCVTIQQLKGILNKDRLNIKISLQGSSFLCFQVCFSPTTFLWYPSLNLSCMNKAVWCSGNGDHYWSFWLYFQKHRCTE